MSLGVHFALSDADLSSVRDTNDPDDLVELLTEDIEERYLDDDQWSFQSDKAWDAIHRCLTDGQLLYASGPFPLAYAVLGGETLDVGDDYTACLVDAKHVGAVSVALVAVTRDWLHERYLSLSETDYTGPIGDEDFDYTWDNFVGLRAFFERAAQGGRAVLFTTDA